MAVGRVCMADEREGLYFHFFCACAGVRAGHSKLLRDRKFEKLESTDPHVFPGAASVTRDARTHTQ